MQNDPNYGRSREPGDEIYGETRQIPGGETSMSTYGGSGTEVSPQDERTWSILSHVSVLAWPITGFLPVAPLIVWLLYKDRSPLVSFHALQSLWYQVAWLVLGVVGGVIGTIFTILTLGVGAALVVPLAVVLGLVPFAHQLYAAYKVGQGENYRYPFIAGRIDGGRREL
jgi:uncharacterized Tic20 family protein